MFYPVLDHLSAIGRKYALRMKLYAPHVVVLVAECHDLAFVGGAGDLQAGRQTGGIDHPGMLTPYEDVTLQSLEEVIDLGGR